MDALAADWTGKACPKCGRVRAPADANPSWQCPGCQVAYAKAAAGAPPRLVAHGRAMAQHAAVDGSLFALVGVNLLALAVALATRMSLRELMLVYWIQSVVIGIASCIRILRLRDFSTEGFTMNNAPLAETPASKYKVAGFFAVHYGIFHTVYLAFVAGDDRAGELGPPVLYVLLALMFAANHVYSLRRNLARDAEGRPNLGTLMFLPYARILPMHLTILSGSLLYGGAGGLLLFGALKTVADAVMHVVEHHVLARPVRDPVNPKENR